MTADGKGVQVSAYRAPEHRVLGCDGKWYPYHPLTGEDRSYLIGHAHFLKHAEGLSVRQIVAALAIEGIRRSVGSVSSYLTAYQCEDCSGEEIRHLNSQKQP